MGGKSGGFGSGGKSQTQIIFLVEVFNIGIGFRIHISLMGYTGVSLMGYIGNKSGNCGLSSEICGIIEA